MIMTAPRRLATFLLALVVIAGVLVLASCVSDPDRDRNHNRPRPQYTGGIWRYQPAALGTTRRPWSPGSGVAHRLPITVAQSGDSIISAGYLPAEQRTASLVRAGLPGDWSLVDESRGGQRLIGGNAHNLVDDWPGILAESHAKIIYVEIGTDDLYGSSDADWEAAYRQIADQATAAGVRIVPCLLTPLVLSKRDLYLREPQRERFNAWLVQAFGEEGVVDLPAVLAAPGSVELDSIYDDGDGMHLDAAGVAVMAAAILAKIR